MQTDGLYMPIILSFHGLQEHIILKYVQNRGYANLIF